MKLANLSKILKCAANDDAITMKSEDGGDTLTFMFESAGEGSRLVLFYVAFVLLVSREGRGLLLS